MKLIGGNQIYGVYASVPHWLQSIELGCYDMAARGPCFYLSYILVRGQYDLV